MSERRPRVSVGVPVYNGERFLAAALESLRAQDFADFEVIVSDNASQDGTRTICERFVALDPRFRYVRNESNLGAARNYNRLVDLARGELFRWNPHDDLCDPSHLRRCVEAFDRSPPDTVLCYPKTRLIDADGAVVRDYEDRAETLAERPSDRLSHLLRHIELCNAVVGLIRLDALRSTRRIGSYIGSDHVLLSELALRGKIVEVPAPLFFRRVHAESSRQANPSRAELMAWFDQRKSWGAVFIRTQMTLAHFDAIARSPLSAAEKLRCAWFVVRDWGPPYWRVIGGEFKLALKLLLRGGPLGSPRPGRS